MFMILPTHESAMLQAAIYARYSSDRQSDASIEDQEGLCEERARREGYQIVETYADRAVSGASMLRPGLHALISDQRHRCAGCPARDLVLQNLGQEFPLPEDS
jgi:hypothetical protein